MKNANPVSRAVRGWGWFLLAALLAAGCGPKGGKGPAPAPKTAAEYFDVRVGGQVVSMQLAVLPAEMERGLMGRERLGPNQGMVFIYAKPQRMSFWMRNTPTPLDIGFFDGAGVLREIYPLHPFDETSVSSRHDQMQFALEMNQGWYRAHGVHPGAQMDLAALAAALKARGFEPARFGLP